MLITIAITQVEGGYSPDTDNIMSYAPPTCLDDLSNGQMIRSHNFITNSSILQALSYIVEISGTSIICSSSSTFTLQNRPSGSTVSWTKSSNLQYVSGQGTNNYTVKAVNSSASGPGWVQATLNSPDGAVELAPKDVWVGKPYAPTSIMFMPYNPYVGGQSVDAFVSSNNPHQANVTYQWDGGPHSLNPETNNWSSVSFKTINTQYWYSTTFRVSASNTCGTSQAYSKLLTVKEQPNGGGDIPERGGNAPTKHLSISPNPASSNIKVTETISTGDDQPWELRLISAQGFVVYSTSTRLPKTIKVNELQLGVYILHAKKGNHVEQHRLTVK